MDTENKMQQFNFPTIIYYGEGSLSALAEKIKNNGHKKVLIVTDENLVKLGIVKEVTKELDTRSIPYDVFDGTHPNPTDKHVENGAEVYQQSGCDALIALGGGSPMDTAKVIKIAVTHPAPLAQYDDAKGGSALIKHPMPPLYAIPTTAGTGSEVGRCGVLVMKGTKAKTIFFHPRLMPDIAVLEAKLTKGLPAHITAATGIDAFVHSLEAYLASGYHPMADGIALEGMKLVIKHLPVACKNGSDLDARGNMLMASMMGATAFQKGLGMIHSLAHPLSARYNMHHGLACALITPSSIELLENSDLNEEQKKRIGIVNHLFKDSDHAKNRLSETLRSFISFLGIEFGLSNHSVPEQDFEKLASQAFRDPCHATNMVPATKDDMSRMYGEAY